jgi:hypothetical protein
VLSFDVLRLAVTVLRRAMTVNVARSGEQQYEDDDDDECAESDVHAGRLPIAHLW